MRGPEWRIQFLPKIELFPAQVDRNDPRTVLQYRFMMLKYPCEISLLKPHNGHWKMSVRMPLAISVRRHMEPLPEAISFITDSTMQRLAFRDRTEG